MRGGRTTFWVGIGEAAEAAGGDGCGVGQGCVQRGWLGLMEPLGYKVRVGQGGSES